MQTGTENLYRNTGSLTLGYIFKFLAGNTTMNTYEAGINYRCHIDIFRYLLVPLPGCGKGWF